MAVAGLCALLGACATPAQAPANSPGAWQLASIGDRPADGAAGVVDPGYARHADGNGGCNSFGGQYEAQRDTLTFSHMISTMMACAGPNGDVMTQERAMMSILNGPVRASVEGDTLALTAIDGRTLHFRRAAQ
ncbi:MAG: META domain-containing protein [Nocardioides sp.]